MGLAPYFHRSAVAAAQVLSGYDEDRIAERLDATPVGITIGDGALGTHEGRDLLDLAVRLLARLYPRLTIDASSGADPWRLLAASINPNIDLDKDEPVATIVIGGGRPQSGTGIYAGSDGWEARLSTAEPQAVGATQNPFGPGTAACLAAASLFRAAFELGAQDVDTRFSTFLMDRPHLDDPELRELSLEGSVLVGAGAIGNGVLWALGRAKGEGQLRVVDHESLELSNVQRYVLTAPADVGRAKVDIALEQLSPLILTHELAWDRFVEIEGYEWRRALVAVDSARARRAVQATLPHWIANAWTQPGDLGVGVHPWTEAGACLSCLYLPAGTAPNEDQLVADALGLSDQADGLEIRTLLHTGAPPSAAFLARVAEARGLEPEALDRYADKPLRHLYTEGICGGALVPLSTLGRPTEAVHVPLAHQSALAGVLLAARLAADSLGLGSDTTLVTRLNLLGPMSEYPTQPAQKDSRGICICQDADYERAWSLKYR